MARTQGFERDAVVRAARTVFWRRGFEDTAVPDLEEATGLSRSSIYNAFGSKRGLSMRRCRAISMKWSGPDCGRFPRSRCRRARSPIM